MAYTVIVFLSALLFRYIHNECNMEINVIILTLACVLKVANSILKLVPGVLFVLAHNISTVSIDTNNINWSTITLYC